MKKLLFAAALACAALSACAGTGTEVAPIGTGGVSAELDRVDRSLDRIERGLFAARIAVGIGETSGLLPAAAAAKVNAALDRVTDIVGKARTALQLGRALDADQLARDAEKALREVDGEIPDAAAAAAALDARIILAVGVTG